VRRFHDRIDVLSVCRGQVFVDVVWEVRCRHLLIHEDIWLSHTEQNGEYEEKPMRADGRAMYVRQGSTTDSAERTE
jgi:hypothetical protein